MTYLDRVDTFMSSLGVETYRVGGSVRDELLGRRPKDADYMVRGVDLDELARKIPATYEGSSTKLTPLKLRDGRQVGWRISVRGLGLIEVALPRTDRKLPPSPEQYFAGNARHQFEIIVDPTLPTGADAVRRDFTFNALYKLIPDGPVADPTATGLYDLQHKLIRTTHPDSFRDDPLRTLRALRFVSTLGYDLASTTLEEMHTHADAVTGLTLTGNTSGTALTELQKLLMGSDVAKALRLARDTGVLQTLLPELAPMCGFDQGSRYHDMTTDEHTFSALETAAHVDAPLRVRMALLFHDAGKPETAWVGTDGRKHYYSTLLEVGVPPATVFKTTQDHEVAGVRLWLEASARMNVPRALRQDVAWLIRHHMVTVVGKVKASKVRRARVLHGDDMLRDLYLHRLCDICGKGKPDKNYMQQIGALERIRQEAQAAGVPCTPKDLEIDGHDIQYWGGEGRLIGKTLHAVLDEVVCDPSDLKLSREWQSERAGSLLREEGVLSNIVNNIEEVH